MRGNAPGGRRPRNDERPWCRGVQLAAQAELAYETPVPADIFSVEVVKEAAAAADEFQKAAPTRVVVRVLPKVFGQFTDSLGEECYLYFG